MQRRLHLPLVDTLWIVLLCVYALAGMMIVPFHPDETEHIRMSQDFASIFVDGNLSAVTDVIDPISGKVAQGDATVRIQEGPLHSYVTGAIWNLAGMTRADLPLPWDWGQDFGANVATGRLPSVAMLAAGRLAAAIFFCVSIVAIYGLGRLFGNRLLALIISGLYGLNPILLMHGRRAMLEAPLLCFGLLTLWIAGVISTRKAGERLSGWWWVALAVAGGLGMAAKYTYVFIFAAALGWIVLSRGLEWLEARQMRNWRTLVKLAGRLVGVGAGALAIFVGLSPALWSNPPARIFDALAIVRNILVSQVNNNQAIALSLPQRFQYAASIPFLTPIEAGHTVETARYSASLLHGLNFPTPIGIILTGLAAFGLFAALITPLGFPARKNVNALRIGLLVWIGAAALTAVQTPLPWQRYFVMFVPLAILLTGIGGMSAARIVRWIVQTRSAPLLQRVEQRRKLTS